MKLVLLLLLIRYLMRLVPASILGGMLIMEDLDGRPVDGTEASKEWPGEESKLLLTIN